MKKQGKCCFCGKKYDNFGNNPAPYLFKGRCCNDCNENNVIPARFFVQEYRLAINGDALAQYLVGGSFYRGRVIEQDYDEAKYWYNEAAKQGNEKAKTALAELFK